MENKEKSCGLLELRARALQLRIDSIRATTASASGHPTTCLSAADIIAALFFNVMKFDLCNHNDKNNDRFILSKGHAAPVLYAAYKQLGVLSDDDLLMLRDINSPLEGHPTPRFVYNEAATGSLGQGLAIAAGMAFNGLMEKRDYTTYVLLGDGEIAEGSVWEAAEFASYYKLGNLIGFVDCNRFGQSGQTLYGHEMSQYEKKFRAFGWETFCVDGHNVEAILKAVSDAKCLHDKPVMILAKTYKGYGLDGIEDKNGFHGKPISGDDVSHILDLLKARFKEEVAYLKDTGLAKCIKCAHLGAHYTKENVPKKKIFALNIESDPNAVLFERGNKLATRKAFGYALAALGRVDNDIVVLDADVKNSTFTDIFEKEFPDRFIQCFIAEQTMVGVATGLQARGKIPFAATFAAFLTRAHDQIRMAGVGQNALRVCGSHCGVSIGEDGPSQMGLEDIAMFRSIPNSIVLYPSDAVSAYKLVGKMAMYDTGISYMRTTREATPVIYDVNKKFSIGGCHVVRQSEEDQACIVAAGITLHEALKAYERLKGSGLFVSVIDAYSVKPLDINTITSVAKKSGNRIITVEDHYVEGGLGEAVASAMAVSKEISVEILAVKEMSRSGKPEELLAQAQINAESIVGLIKK